MLAALNWDVHVVTPHAFLLPILQLSVTDAKERVALRAHALCFIEVAMVGMLSVCAWMRYADM